ncbi:hypothetical protein PMAYCL1PPCAC_13987, partial [Pristionchus mayeri]
LLLDTGADASLIDEQLLSGMEAVEIEEIKKNDGPVLRDANQNPINLRGKAVLDVKLQIGKAAKIGFYVTRARVGVIIGGAGLDAIGVELREKQDKDEDMEDAGEAVVLRHCVIARGEMDMVWTNGVPGSTVILDSSMDGVVEGIAMNESVVPVPVMNTTDKEMVFEKLQSAGRWKKCVAPETGGAAIKKIHRESHAEDMDRWREIEEKMKKNNPEGLMKTRSMVERSNEDEVTGERDKKIEEWRIDQSRDEWVEMVKNGLEDVRLGKREADGKVEMPFSSMDLSWADFKVHNGLLYLMGREHQLLLYVPESRRKKLVKQMHESVLLGHSGSKKLLQLLKKEFVWGGMDKEKTLEEVNRRLDDERRKMKETYDKKFKHNKGIEPKIGDRVYIKKELNGSKNPKLEL